MSTENVKSGEIIPSNYGIEILLENTELSKTKNSGFPTDAYNVIYNLNPDKEDRIDVCRGNRVKIFDYYYDKYGKGIIKSITWGSGKVNPRVWKANKETSKKKKRQ